MKTIKISASLINTYETVRLEKWGADTDQIIEYITGTLEPNRAMSRGTAFHLMLEHGPEKYAKYKATNQAPEDSFAHYETKDEPAEMEISHYEVHEPELGVNWLFSPEAVEPVIEFRNSNPWCVYEQWGEYRTKIRGYEVVSRQRYDGMQFLSLMDFKTTGSAKKYTDYLDALQWRLYLLGKPEALEFQYHIFQLPRLTEKSNFSKWCRSYGWAYQRYEGLERDVNAKLSEFIEWLEHYPKLIEALEI